MTDWLRKITIYLMAGIGYISDLTPWCETEKWGIQRYLREKKPSLQNFLLNTLTHTHAYTLTYTQAHLHTHDRLMRTSWPELERLGAFAGALIHFCEFVWVFECMWVSACACAIARMIMRVRVRECECVSVSVWVCECASVRVFACASVRVFACASVRVCACASVRVCECASVRVCTYES